MTEESVKELLQQINYPGFSRDIVSFGLVKVIKVEGDKVYVKLELTTPNREVAEQLDSELTAKLHDSFGEENVRIEVHIPSAAESTPTPQQTSGIQKIIAVASGKGGVGKSTTSANLACAFQKMGLQVGLLDCDIYGPSIPLMMGVSGRPEINSDEKLVPLDAKGVKIMSMGFINEGDNPVIWRGPMIVKTIQQFLFSVDWGALDVLLVDLPPGTGDAQLTLCQTVPLSGGVIVTTPQEASLGVVRKGINMFKKVNVPILGIIENMSYFQDTAGVKNYIFGEGGGKLEANHQNVPFLGEIPLVQSIREGGDAGSPVTSHDHENEPGVHFFQAAQTLYKNVIDAPAAQ